MSTNNDFPPPSDPQQLTYGAPSPQGVPDQQALPPYGGTYPAQGQSAYHEQPTQAGYPASAYPEAKSRVAAGILGILFGSLGAHNFYLGRAGKAIVQLLITVLSLGVLAPISATWGLVEGILILTSSPQSSWGRDADGRPLRS
ncbi:TM2 domain-containing protein [Nanchangia anserum]|nr:TM2 domain-containing protein [Nanchangia anserum]